MGRAVRDESICSEGRISWLLQAIVAENGFADGPEEIIEEFSEVLDLPPGQRIDILSECYMSYPNHAY